MYAQSTKQPLIYSYIIYPQTTQDITPDVLNIQGGSLDFWNGCANVLIWDLQFGIGEIILGLKFRGSRCAICGLKFGIGQII